MTNEMINDVENTEETEAPLTVEVPSGIRAGVLTAPAVRNCSPYSSCYRILVAVAAAE
jgi:hypothetical protein